MKTEIPYFTKGRVFKILLFIYDVIVVNFAFYIAIIIRFTDKYSFQETGNKYMNMFIRFAPGYTVACMLLFVLFHMYSVVWRYAGFNDIKKIVVVNLCTGLLYVFGSLLIVGRMPISVYLLGIGIQFILMLLLRMAPRYVLDSIPKTRDLGSEGITIPLMIVGIGENARIIQDKIARDRTNIVRPVCVIDYSYGYIGNTFNGLPVFSGMNSVEECIEKFDIKCVIIADDKLPKDFLDNIRKCCEDKNIEVRDFVIGTNYHTRGGGLRELLEVVEGSVQIQNEDGNCQFFSDGSSAIKVFKEGYSVSSVLTMENSLLIKICSTESEREGAGEDWVKKYREEMGSDVSFF